MMIDRRTFVAGAGVVALAPALKLAPTQLPIPEDAAGGLILLIEGWSVPQSDADDDVVSMRIHRSWRTAWR
jgi:hypothetical protein